MPVSTKVEIGEGGYSDSQRLFQIFEELNNQLRGRQVLFSHILKRANLMADKLRNLQKTKQKNKLRLPILPKYFKFQTTYNLY